jgi:hypothetical protein
MKSKDLSRRNRFVSLVDRIISTGGIMVLYDPATGEKGMFTYAVTLDEVFNVMRDTTKEMLEDAADNYKKMEKKDEAQNN